MEACLCRIFYPQYVQNKENGPRHYRNINQNNSSWDMFVFISSIICCGLWLLSQVPNLTRSKIYMVFFCPVNIVYCVVNHDIFDAVGFQQKQCYQQASYIKQ